MVRSGKEDFHARIKLPLLLMIYPGLAGLLANTPHEYPAQAGMESLVATINTATGLLIAGEFLFLAAVPMWSRRRRKEPLGLTRSFRCGLRVVSGLMALVIPIQGVLLAVGLFIADPKELWFWGIFIAGGAIVGTIVLLTAGMHAQPGTFLTLRAALIQPDEHPKLGRLLLEVAESNQVSLPSAILVGLQAELFCTTSTVFCPDGEFAGGVLCLSLPTSSILSIDEFRALMGEALMGLQRDLEERRSEFHSTMEAAKDALNGIDDTMRQWTWLPKFGFHPYLMAFWIVLVAAMRFPLYLGSELLKYYVREFWVSRRAVDMFHSIEQHHASSDEVGAIQAISARFKEAAVSLLPRLLNREGSVPHPLSEVAKRVYQDHPELALEFREPAYGDPNSAWQYLQFRCGLSGVSLEWCRQIAFGVSPEPSAASLFQDTAALQARLVELVNSPFVCVKR